MTSNDRTSRETGGLRLWLMLALFSVAILAPAPGMGAAPSASEYRLEPGDVIEVSIAAIAGFRENATIGIDGTIMLPLAGAVKIDGETMAAAAKKIAARLNGKVYRQSALGGEEVSHLILGNEVVASIAQYRPIYVTGDVAKPGEYPFRPGLTVRQAVAIAGGYGLARLGTGNPWIAGVDLQSDYTTLRDQLAREEARVWRLHKELAELGDGSASVPFPPMSDPAGHFMKTAKRELESRIASRTTEKASYQAAADKAGQQLLILRRKEADDKEGVQADDSEFKQVRGLFERHLSTSMRLAESRRAALLSSDQYLQTVVEISNLERQRDTSERLLKKVDNDARVAALTELQDANLAITQTSARLAAASKKLVLMGAMQSQLEHGEQPPRIVIHRKTEGQQTELAARPDEELMPGDVVDVTVPFNGAPMSATAWLANGPG